MHDTGIDWAALGSWASFVATLVVGGVIYGMLAQKTKDNSEDIREIKGDLRDAKKVQVIHGNDIAAIKAHLALDK